jgi:hypothetical protein
VSVNGKKLWVSHSNEKTLFDNEHLFNKNFASFSQELLITDGSGNFKHVESIPANKVNSREVRSRVEAVIAASAVRPRQIRLVHWSMILIDFAHWVHLQTQTF